MYLNFVENTLLKLNLSLNYLLSCSSSYINLFKNQSLLNYQQVSSTSINFKQTFYSRLIQINLILCTFFILSFCSSISASPLSHRNDDFNHDVLCANQAFDLMACQNYARNKWGLKQDERNLCCYFIEVQTCVIKRREEFCRGEFLDAFKKEYQRNMDHWKNTKCRNYFQNTNCEEEFEIWTLAALIMLCLISGMACITLGVLYTKK